jgi:hypothetical protein
MNCSSLFVVTAVARSMIAVGALLLFAMRSGQEWEFRALRTECPPYCAWSSLREENYLLEL